MRLYFVNRYDSKVTWSDGWEETPGTYRKQRETGRRNGGYVTSMKSRQHGYDPWFLTFEEAKLYLLSRLEGKIDLAKREIDRCELALAALHAQAPPEAE